MAKVRKPKIPLGGEAMDYSNLWSSTETNKYLYKQLKLLLVSKGFVESSFKTKHLIRIREHHLQIVAPEVLYGETNIQMFVVPLASYSSYLYCSARLSLKRSNQLKTTNHYGDLALQRETGKPYYRPEEIQKVWADVMEPQIESEIVAYFNSFGFPQFAHLSQNWRDGTLSYNAAFGNNDALREFAIACNSIWMGEYESSLPPLKKAIAGYVKSYHLAIECGRTVDLDQQKNKESCQEILNIMDAQNEGFETVVIEKLRFLEQDAPAKTWGVALDADGNTIALKKPR